MLVALNQWAQRVNSKFPAKNCVICNAPLQPTSAIWIIVTRTGQYIENNSIKIGLPRQCWPFIIPYDRWPLHEGHSPNSPYAKALRAVGRYP
jgi:hypothetical protein